MAPFYARPLARARRGGGQISPPPRPRRQIATMITRALSTSPALARPRRPLRVNRIPIAARMAPTAANGISSQLVMPTIGSRARIIQASATMPQIRLISPMRFLRLSGVMPGVQDGCCAGIVTRMDVNRPRRRGLAPEETGLRLGETRPSGRPPDARGWTRSARPVHSVDLQRQLAPADHRVQQHPRHPVAEVPV